MKAWRSGPTVSGCDGREPIVTAGWPPVGGLGASGEGGKLSKGGTRGSNQKWYGKIKFWETRKPPNDVYVSLRAADSNPEVRET